MHISRIFPAAVLCMLFSQKGFPQETKARCENVKFFVVDERIMVTYDLLKASPQERFEILLEFENVGTAEIIPTSSVEGDVGQNVGGGRGKTIYWDVFKDLPDGIDFEIKPLLTIIRVERIYGGPANALKSLIVPGLGDYAVRNHREMIFKPYVKTILGYGLVGAGVMRKMSFDRQYEDYLNTEDPDEFQSLYDKSRSTYYQTYILYGAGAAIWLSDIAWVAIRGVQNSKESENRFTGRADHKVLLGYNEFGPSLKYVIRF